MMLKRSADFVEFLGLAGLGQAEAAALTWPDIDWQRETDHNVPSQNEVGLRDSDLSAIKALLSGNAARRRSPNERQYLQSMR